MVTEGLRSNSNGAGRVGRKGREGSRSFRAVAMRLMSSNAAAGAGVVTYSP